MSEGQPGISEAEKKRDEKKHGLTLEKQLAYAVDRSNYKTEYIEHLKQQHEKEPLTGLNRREVFERELEGALGIIRGEIPEKREHAEPLTRVSVIMIDLDHFKQVNDTFGHEAGDAVLEAVGKIVEDSVRVSDTATMGRTKNTAARYGGEELMVLMPNVSAETAAIHAEDIRSKIEQLTFAEYPTLKPTASFGVACSSEATPYANQILKRADEVLYQAKGNGRNRVEVYTES